MIPVMYRAVHSQPQRGGWPPTPSRVIKTFVDAEGRLCHSIIAVCESATEDNNAHAEFIAEAFNRKTAVPA